MTPAPHTRQRINQVLSDIANADKDSIDYKSFIQEVRGVALRSSDDPASTFRKILRDEVAVEVAAGRLVVDKTQVPPLLLLTPAGKDFFVGLAAPPLVLPQPAAPQFSVAKVKALDDYYHVASLLLRIKDIISQRTLNDVETTSVVNLPRIIRSYLEGADMLRDENFDLSSRLNDVSWEVDNLQAQME